MSKDLIFQLINFAILVGGLGWILKRTLGSFFKNERAEWQRKIAEAGEQYEQAKKELNEAESLLKNIDRRVGEIKEVSLRELKFERTRMIEDAASFSEKLVKDCEIRIKSESERAKVMLEKEIWEASMAAAKQKIRQDLKAKDREWTGDFLEHEHKRAARASGEK